MPSASTSLSTSRMVPVPSVSPEHNSHPVGMMQDPSSERASLSKLHAAGFMHPGLDDESEIPCESPNKYVGSIGVFTNTS